MPVRNNVTELLIKKMAEEKRIITEADLARAINVPRQTVNLWMHNKITSFKGEIIDGMCRFFNCQVGDLLVLVDEPLSNTSTQE